MFGQAHPWVTKGGKDLLLSEEENTAALIGPPTEAEMAAAITSNMRNLMTVVKAVNKFKALTATKQQAPMSSILGDQIPAHFSQPPGRIRRKPVPLPHLEHKSHSVETFDRDHHEGALVAEGVHRDINSEQQRGQQQTLQIPTRATKALSDPPKPVEDTDSDTESFLSQFPTADEGGPIDVSKLPPFRSSNRAWGAQTADEIGQRGHAKNPLGQQLYLFIGPSTFSGESSEWDQDSSFVPGDDDIPIVSESPGAADVDIYETAYRDEVERILARAKAEEREPNVYLTRRMDAKLLAISGWAGKWMAGAEEAASNIDYYTNFTARRARVTEVSRALRQAAKEEYEKRRQERRAVLAQARQDKGKARDETGAAGDSVQSESRPISPDVTDSPLPISPGQHRDNLRLSSMLLKGKAVDKGRQAKTSFKGLVDAVKSRTKSKDESS